MIHERTTTSLLLDRRRLLRTAWWAAVSGGSASLALAGVRYLWPHAALPSDLVLVPAAHMPPPGGDPVLLGGERFYLVNLSPGEGPPPYPRATTALPSAGGVLALLNRCPGEGCSVMWRRTLRPYHYDLQSGFRCPCHGEIYTKAGLVAFGQAPRPLDTLFTRFVSDGSLLIDTTRITPGDRDNPQRAVSS